MLFDVAPKGSRANLFDGERAQRGQVAGPLIMLVIGLRRTGKSSVIRVAVNELEADVGTFVSYSEVYNYLGQLMKHSWIVKEDDRYCPRSC